MFALYSTLLRGIFGEKVGQPNKMHINPSTITQHDHSGIDVLIVGAGIGGLFCAVEMYRQGHNVRVLESNDELCAIGDFLGIGVSAIRQLAKWPGMTATYKRMRYKPVMTFFKSDGERLCGPYPAEDTPEIPVPIHRPTLQRILYDYVLSLGISVSFGNHISEYFEARDKAKAGVVTTNGARFEADLVIAADGVGSKSWKIIQGSKAEAQSSGFSVYRTSFPIESAYKNPVVAKNFPVMPDGKDDVRMYLGPDTHAITLTSKNDITWTLTHKDNGNSAESWSKRVAADSVLREIASAGIEWDPALIALIKQTPGESVVDWRLLWRNPASKWVSDCGRVVQLGDAAHFFLPTSANGGTQACEDAISLAACLSLAGKHNIPLATRIHNILRFERVACCQRLGFRNRKKWHHVDYEDVKIHPEKLGEMTGRWITQHEPEQYVYDNWEECVNALVSGRKFNNTNIPPGYEYKPWTIDEASIVNEETPDVDAGDWS